jgi:tRNA 2-thiouridine synthesizing protein A
MDRQLDCRGMRCPLPVIYARKALASMRAGDELTVVTTDPESVEDFADFCRASCTQLLAQRDDGGDHVFRMRKT